MSSAFYGPQSSGSLATSCHIPQRKSSSAFPGNIRNETDLWDNYTGAIPPQTPTLHVFTNAQLKF